MKTPKGRLFSGLVILFLVAGVPVFSRMAASPVEAAEVNIEDTEIAADTTDYSGWFEISEISDEVFARIQGKSYKDNCRIPLEDLRYVTIAHYDFDSQVKRGELICNRAIADDLVEIFRNLFDQKYPIESVRLIDDFDADDIKSMQANNTSCFNYREIAGSTKLSNHARGMAIDINPLYNPYVKSGKGKAVVSPPESAPYVDRSKEFAGKIDRNDPCYKEFAARGFKWGGDWKSLKDYQHFEK